jgi:NAD+-dependent farnesol dehydrogenase
MLVLVTGGTGYLGRAIVHALVRHGHAPIVFARQARASGLPGTLVDGDVRDKSAVDRAAHGVDAICHTAALVSVWKPRPSEFEEVNVGGLRTVLEVCAERRIQRLVYTSSFLALPPADGTVPLTANHYQRTKAAARIVAASAASRGSPVVTLFPGVIYGPGVATEGNLVGRLISDHRAGRLPGLIGADRPWSYAFVDDVAEGHVAALERGRPGAEYKLGGENAPQMRVFEILRHLTGTRLPRRIPFAIADVVAVAEEARSALFKRPPLLTRGIVEIFRHDWSLDSGESVRELGYRITPLETGMKTMVTGGI